MLEKACLAVVELEKAESTIKRDMGKNIERMKIFTSGGIEFSIDDFGTGYSSLAYLKHFPISTLKIDQAFVSDLPHDLSDV